MLKKAGILVAVAAAGVLAVAPLAFASERVTTTETSPSCTFASGSDGSSAGRTAGGVIALLGAGGTAANVHAPVTTQANAPAGSCNNVSDVLDSHSNNSTTSIDNSKTTDNSKTATTTTSTSVFQSIATTLGL